MATAPDRGRDSHKGGRHTKPAYAGFLIFGERGERETVGKNGKFADIFHVLD